MSASKQFEIRKRETFEHGIQRLLDQLNSDTAKLVIAGSRVHISIHEARKNIKKLRAVLRLIRHEIGKEKYSKLNTFYREVGQQVALLRDDTSIIELLENFKQSVKSPHLQKVIKKSIRLTKEKREKEFAEFHKNKSHFQLNKILSEKNEVLSQLNIPGDPEFFILKGVDKVYSDIIEKMKQAELEGTNEAYHNLRKQVKNLMYHMMLLKNAWPAYFEAYIIELDKLQKLLGNLHDLNILNNYVVEGNLLPLEKKQKEILLKYIYPRRANIKKQVHNISDLLLAESSQAFSKRLLGIWINSGFAK